MTFREAPPDTFFVSIRGDGEEALATLVRSKAEVCRLLRIGVFGHDGPLGIPRDEEDAQRRQKMFLDAFANEGCVNTYERMDSVIVEIYRVRDEELPAC